MTKLAFWNNGSGSNSETGLDVGNLLLPTSFSGTLVISRCEVMIGRSYGRDCGRMRKRRQPHSEVP